MTESNDDEGIGLPEPAAWRFESMKYGYKYDYSREKPTQPLDVREFEPLDVRSEWVSWVKNRIDQVFHTCSDDRCDCRRVDDDAVRELRRELEAIADGGGRTMTENNDMDMSEKPQSAADPRPGGEPYYIDNKCEECGEELVLDAEYQAEEGEAIDEDEIWHDEWRCPECENLYLDVPDSFIRKLKPREGDKRGKYVDVKEIGSDESWVKRFTEKYLRNEDLLAIGNLWIGLAVAGLWVLVFSDSLTGYYVATSIFVVTFIFVHFDAMHTAAGKGLEKRVERLEEELEEAQR